MAKIDAMLKMMSEKSVERVVLRGDKPYRITTAGRTVEVAVTPREQVLQILEEIVPPSLSPGLKSGSSFHFQHSSPFGAFDVGVMGDLGTFEVTVTPAKVERSPQVSLDKGVAAHPVSPAPSAPPAPSQGVIIPASSPSWPPNGPTGSPPPPSHPAPPTAYPPAHHQPPYYGPAPYDPRQGQVSSRSKVAAGLLALFLGALGVHRFYLGYNGLGITFLVLTFILSIPTCGLTFYAACVWATIEGIIILCGGMPDAEGRPLS